MSFGLNWDKISNHSEVALNTEGYPGDTYMLKNNGRETLGSPFSERNTVRTATQRDAHFNPS